MGCTSDVLAFDVFAHVAVDVADQVGLYHVESLGVSPSGVAGD